MGHKNPLQTAANIAAARLSAVSTAPAVRVRLSDTSLRAEACTQLIFSFAGPKHNFASDGILAPGRVNLEKQKLALMGV